MTEDKSDRIIVQLATLSESVASLRRDGERYDELFERERQHDHESRRELYEKVNGVAQDLAAIKGDIKVTAMVAAQARDSVNELKATVEAAAPTIADVEQAKKIGAIVLWLLGGRAVAVIAAVLAFGDAVRTGLAAVAHWAGIR